MRCSLDLPLAAQRLVHGDALRADVASLRYVTDTRALALAQMGIYCVADLLLHIPRRYLDFTHTYTIEDAPIGTRVTIVASVDRVVQRRPRPRMHVTQVYLTDDTALMQVAFFKQPWLAQQIKPGDRLAVQGKLEFAYGFKQMASPHFEILDAHAPVGSILPIHPATEAISPAWMRRLMSEALLAAGTFADPLPAPLRAEKGLMSASRALRSIHFPYALCDIDAARRRLAFDELLYLQLALRLRMEAGLQHVASFAHTKGAHFAALTQAFPFEFTPEQTHATDEILTDMTNGERSMNRLLLGDVGTGKTAVAALALAVAADSHTQACVMVPTSVLAEQYAHNLGPLLDTAGISWALLCGSTGSDERARVLEQLAAGTISVLFGTHALLSDDVRFSHLTLVVIDEQHRFGVQQRARLRARGPGADMLVMSATPIPRTLALSLYGDLETSVIVRRPFAHAGTTTRVLDNANRDIALGALREALSAGQQAYVICPLISATDSESELEDVPDLSVGAESEAHTSLRVHNVEDERRWLSQIFPEARIEVLHSRLSEQEKLRTMSDFRAGVIQILVATTMVEIGIDVPRATIMLIENGERFGLATLHQLRGRIGRADLPGRCFVLSELRATKGRRTIALERLTALEESSDGFELAQRDLRLRHEGEILGYRQSGGVSLHFVDMVADEDLIEAARDFAADLMREDPQLTSARAQPLREEALARFRSIYDEVSGT